MTDHRAELPDLVRRFFRQFASADAELTMNNPDEGMALADTMNRMKEAVGIMEADQ